MIDHDGIIEHIEGDVAHVKISSESACASCHAKGACIAADQQDKYLEIQVESGEFNTGENVKVMVSRQLGLKAVALGYVYPLLVLMAILIILITVGMEELKAAPFALLSLPAYYLVLYLSRKRIGQKFTFSIQKTPAVQ